MMFRSLIFVSSNIKRFINKAKVVNADIICFDLEDSVPVNEKAVASQTIMEALTQRTEYKSNIYIRINSFESGLAPLDLNAIIRKGIDGIVIPKVNDEIEFSTLVDLISTLEQKRGIEKNSIKLLPSIETAKGVVNARAKVPVDARAAGVASIDGIWQKVDDIDGLRNDAIIAKRLGYSGKSIIHPNQIETVHKIFVPNRNEIEWAKKVVEALGEAMEEGVNRGAVKLEGKMIDAVHYKQAKAILDAINNNLNLENPK